MSSVLTDPEAVRIFLGYRNPDSTPEQFRIELGRTFMPGTPYMLQPLGLHAYAALAIDEGLGIAHESGLIAYPSQTTYQSIRNGTLRGRIYTQSHGGLYDLSRSGAQWATAPGTATSHTFHLFDRAVDLQVGALGVVVAVRIDPNADLSRVIVDQAEALTEQLAGHGVDQAFVTANEEFFVLWAHWPDAYRIGALASWSVKLIEVKVDQPAERAVILEEPARVEAAPGRPYSFIFERSGAAGLV